MNTNKNFLSNAILIIITLFCFSPLLLIPFMDAQSMLPLLMVFTFPLWLGMVISLSKNKDFSLKKTTGSEINGSGERPYFVISKTTGAIMVIIMIVSFAMIHFQP